MSGKRGGLKITPRFWLIMLGVAYVCITVAMVRDSSGLNYQQQQIDQLEQQRTELRLYNEQLRSEVEFSGTDEFIERQARARGMIRPGETRYVLSAEVYAGNAQGSN